MEQENNTKAENMIKNTQIWILIVLSILVVNCKATYNNSNHNAVIPYYIAKSDSISIEEILLHDKNIIFSELYDKSKTETYKKKNITQCDTLKDRTHYYFDLFDLHISKDKNKEVLFRKWLDKEEFFINRVYPEHPDGSLDLARALDFYNSDDLAIYLDSLRLHYYKDRFEHKYKSNPPKDATIPYICRTKFQANKE